MAIKVSDAVWEHSAATKSQLLVMLCIADAADPDGSNAWPRQDTICRMTRLSPTAVKDAIAKCIERGEIEVERRDRRRGNRYTVLLPSLAIYEARRAENRPSKNEGRNPAVNDLEGRIPAVGEPESGCHEGRNSALLIEEPSLEPSYNRVEGQTIGARIAEELCDLLGELIVANGETSSNINPRAKAWLDAARLMVDKDGRDPDQARALIRWCQADEFWKPNIQSMPTFRRQYNTLRLQSERGGKGMRVVEPTPMPVPDQTEVLAGDTLARVAVRLGEILGEDQLATSGLSDCWFGSNGSTLVIGHTESHRIGWIATRYAKVLMQVAIEVLGLRDVRIVPAAQPGKAEVAAA